MVKLLQQEGIPQFSLGFAPFSGVREREPFQHSLVTKMSFSFYYSYLNSLYNFKGQELRKRRYRGCAVPLFVASRGQLFRTLLDLLAICKVSNFSIGTQIIQALGFSRFRWIKSVCKPDYLLCRRTELCLRIWQDSLPVEQPQWKSERCRHYGGWSSEQRNCIGAHTLPPKCPRSAGSSAFRLIA